MGAFFYLHNKNKAINHVLKKCEGLKSIYPLVTQRTHGSQRVSHFLLWWNYSFSVSKDCELLSWELQLHVMFPEQFQSIISSGSFTDIFWQVWFSQGLGVCLKSAVNYCLSIVSDKWRPRTGACNSLGDRVPFSVSGLYLHTVTLMNGQVIW